ncbi:SPLICING FACTOR PROLINE- AND GLUTAMINE-RICH-LIKE [Salix purpurea]|uniref:SPLICING FACTOR PROLINE- AND GLUTAMINE-RICH-LIKE n=1 Tax=Salix purpurea TaxID=77065 RepID=A0A9Q0TXX5_SALPP|nr:SPLICING FACTOR PROLINE- AND GLUTAMINE-RICH-LIKE [Salix purpurea]
MGTEVLRPQDCLIERIGVPPCRRRNYYYGNGNFPNPEVYSTSNYHSNSNSNPRSNKKPTAVRFESSGQRKKQSEPSISRKSGTVDDLKIPRNNRVAEKVTALRRGESLESSLKKGHGNGVSPAPSSLPLPSFSKKKQVSTDDAATRDLRRLLRLEF